MVIDPEEPVVGAEGERQGEERQRHESEPAHVDREGRIAVAILPDREAAEEQRRADEKEEIENGAHQEEMPIQVAAFAVENGIVAHRDVHPFVEMMAIDDDRDEEHHHHGEQQREVLELAPDDDRPFRVDDMVDDDPKETTG